MKTSPKRAVRLLLLLLVCAACFLDYWGYSTEFHRNPTAYFDIVQGTAAAPQQYRVLVVRAAWVLQQHSPLVLRYSFTLFDLLTAAAAGLVLLKLLERSSAFRAAGTAARWLGYASFLGLYTYYLGWLVWYQRPETLPTTFFISMMLLLVSWRTSSVANLLLIAAGTLLVSLLQALTRADVAFCFYAAVFLYSAFSRRLPAPRTFQLALSAAAAALAASTQWYMMHHVYPHATYGDTAMIQLPMNLREPTRIMPFLLFLAPVLWTAARTMRRHPDTDAPALALLLGAGMFLPLWLVLGKIDEVRIFLPFSVALIPATVSIVLGALQQTLTPGLPEEA